MKYTSIAVLLLVNGSGAVKLEREPLFSAPQRNEWAFETAKAKGPDHPVDYFVPDFGMDKEIANTQRTIKDTEVKMNHELTFKQGPPPPEHPKDYFVPDFGVDHDVKVTLQHADNAEKQYGHFWDATAKPPKPHPVDYFVPSFGKDKEIKGTEKSIADAEAFLNHKLVIQTKPAPEPPRDYAVPNFGMDHDIKDSLHHLKSQESVHGPMSLPSFVQIEESAQREPLLSNLNSQKWKGKYPINYFVPNFGEDYDVRDSKTHTVAAEERLSHKWEPY